jgi:DNA-binding IclR family transcriptional regulator
MASKTKDSQAKYRVPALEKGFDILEELAGSSTPMTLTQLAKRLDRSTNEIFRVLSALESRGYIRREEHSGSYRLSLKLYELAHQHPPLQTLLQAAEQPMIHLAETLRESCHLSILRGGNLVVLRQALSPTHIRLSIDVGGRFPPVNTVSGRLLLAQIPLESLDAFLANDDTYQSMDAPERTLFAERIERIREQGFSMAEHETHVGVRDYAALVGNPNAGLSAALTVAALTSLTSPTDGTTIVNALHACAHQITEELGIHHEG